MAFLVHGKNFSTLGAAVEAAQKGIKTTFFNKVAETVHNATSTSNSSNHLKQVEITIPEGTEVDITNIVKLELVDGVDVKLVGTETSTLVFQPTASIRILSKSRAESKNKIVFRFHGLRFRISENPQKQKISRKPKDLEEAHHTYIKTAPGVEIILENCTLGQESDDEPVMETYSTISDTHKFLSIKNNAGAQIINCNFNNSANCCFEISCSGGAISLQDTRLNGFTIKVKKGANIVSKDCRIGNQHGIGMLLEGLSTTGTFSKVNIANALVGFQVSKHAKADFTDCGITKCKRNGGEVLNAECCFRKTRFVENGEIGLLVGDLAKVTVLSGSLFRKNARSGLQVFTKLVPPGSEKLDCYTQCEVVNGSFLQNKYGVGIDNASVKLLGSTFYQNQDTSIDLKFDEMSLRKLRNSVIKLQWNNFFENHSHETNNLAFGDLVKSEHSFRGNEEFEIHIWTKELYERLQKADRIAEFKSGNNQETIRTLLESVRHCFSLVPAVKAMVLEYLLDTVNATRCSFFAATYDIGSNGQKRFLFEIEEILENWRNLRYPGYFDSAIACFEEYYEAGNISKNRLEEVRQTLQGWQIVCFHKSKIGRQLNYFKVLSTSHPMRAYFLASGFEKGRLHTMAMSSLAISSNNAENTQKLHISWIAKDALDSLGRAFAEETQPQDYDIFLKWCELQLDIGSPGVVIKAIKGVGSKSDASRNLLDEALHMVDSKSFGAKPKQSLESLIALLALEFIGEGPLPGFFRRLSERSKGILELLELLVNVNPFPYQKYLINAAVHQMLIPDRQPIMSLKAEKCAHCSLLFEPSDLIKVGACKLDHYWCEPCFQLSFASDTSLQDFGKCPGGDCDALASRRDMEAAHIKVETISNIMEHRIGEALAKRVTGWRLCFVENCCGGGAEIIDNSYYICVLCGAFNALEGAAISLHHDLSVQRLLTQLYQNAVYNSQHQEHYFPFEGCGQVFLDKFGNPDLQKLRDKVNHLPSGNKGARDIGKDHQVFSLLKYILSQPTAFRSMQTLPLCVKAILKKTRESNQLDALNGFEAYQVQLDQKSEIEFQMEKRRYGSYYCWHGSNPHNWHSILKTGLKVMSGSKYQANGAAYGAGIYVSPNFSVASGYSRYYYNNNNRRKNKKNRETFTSAICLCEIVDHKNIKKNNTIYVVPEEKWCQIRFVFAEFN